MATGRKIGVLAVDSRKRLGDIGPGKPNQLPADSTPRVDENLCRGLVADWNRLQKPLAFAAAARFFGAPTLTCSPAPNLLKGLIAHFRVDGGLVVRLLEKGDNLLKLGEYLVKSKANDQDVISLLEELRTLASQYEHPILVNRLLVAIYIQGPEGMAQAGRILAGLKNPAFIWRISEADPAIAPQYAKAMLRVLTLQDRALASEVKRVAETLRAIPPCFHETVLTYLGIFYDHPKESITAGIKELIEDIDDRLGAEYLDGAQVAAFTIPKKPKEIPQIYIVGECPEVAMGRTTEPYESEKNLKRALANLFSQDIRWTRGNTYQVTYRNIYKDKDIVELTWDRDGIFLKMPFWSAATRYLDYAKPFSGETGERLLYYYSEVEPSTKTPDGIELMDFFFIPSRFIPEEYLDQLRNLVPQRN